MMQNRPPVPAERPGVRALRGAPPMDAQMRQMHKWAASQRPAPGARDDDRPMKPGKG